MCVCIESSIKVIKHISQGSLIVNNKPLLPNSSKERGHRRDPPQNAQAERRDHYKLRIGAETRDPAGPQAAAAP